MHTLIGVGGIIVLLKIAEFFGAPPVVRIFVDKIERLCSNEIERIFWAFVVFAVGFILAALIGSLTIGLQPAVVDFGTACVAMLLGSVAASWVIMSSELNEQGRKVLSGRVPDPIRGIPIVLQVVFITGLFGTYLLAYLVVNVSIIVPSP